SRCASARSSTSFFLEMSNAARACFSLKGRPIMSLLSDHKTSKKNAREYLLRLFHEMREVMASDLHHRDKHTLIHSAHLKDVACRVWLIRPEKPGLDAPEAVRHSNDDAVWVYNALNTYMDALKDLLGYRAAVRDLQNQVALFRSLLDMNCRPSDIRKQIA